MRRWWQLGTRNWRVNPGRSAAAVTSIALGVATVVVMTSLYETARRAIQAEVVSRWLGAAHLSINPPGAHHGHLDVSLADDIAALEGVERVTARLQRRMYYVDMERDVELVGKDVWWIDGIGINPETEAHFRTFPNLTGRMIRSGERGVAIMERPVAKKWGIELGQKIAVARNQGGARTMLTVIGLIDSERIADFQQPNVFMAIEDAQQIVKQPATASAIDVMLHDASPDSLEKVRTAVEEVIRRRHEPHKVESAAARYALLEEADRLTRFALMLTAMVAQLTAFFIILTTMGVSLFQRQGLMGVMRCIGFTRGQLSTLLLAELVPLGAVGTMLGLAMGVGVMLGLPHVVGDGSQTMYFSQWGMVLSAVSGFATTMLSAAALLFQVGRVTPMAAVTNQARAPRMRYVVICAVLGVVLIAAYEGIIRNIARTNSVESIDAIFSVLTAYGGYVLIAPALVLLIGRPTVRAVGWLMGLRGKLTDGEFVRAPWRSAAVCWMLMVGLSLIVFVAVWAETLVGVWDFPAQLPETFVWSSRYVGTSAVERVRALPVVTRCSIIADIDCEIVNKRVERKSLSAKLMDRLLAQFTRPVFVTADAGDILSMLELDFVEGSLEDSLAKLDAGGHVLIPTQAAHNHNLHLGDTITIRIKGRTADFTIAGVVQSPAMDMAVSFFQATSYMEFAAASAVLGTRADMQEKFGLDYVSMFMCDLDLAETAPPPGFGSTDLPDHTDSGVMARAVLDWADHLPNEQALIDDMAAHLRALVDENVALPAPIEAELRRFALAVRYLTWRSDRYTAEENWAALRERLALLNIAHTMDRPDAIMGSLRRLKHAVETSIRHATVVFTWIPSIALAVAAIGIGNLIMVSVHARSRQIAVLRAVGATKSQILRLVLAEAVALGFVGSIIGLTLGLHQARSEAIVVGAITGFQPRLTIPYATIAAGVALTVGVCLIAGIGPARRAARNNIVAAMQTT